MFLQITIIMQFSELVNRHYQNTWTVYGKLVSDVLSKVQRGDAYPQAHEQCVSKTFERSLMAAASGGLLISTPTDSMKRLKVLEVGIGSTCRTFQRGLYNSALDALHSTNSQFDVDFIGVDLDIPSSKVLNEAWEILAHLGISRDGTPNGSVLNRVTLDVLAADIVQGLPLFGKQRGSGKAWTMTLPLRMLRFCN